MSQIRLLSLYQRDPKPYILIFNSHHYQFSWRGTVAEWLEVSPVTGARIPDSKHGIFNNPLCSPGRKWIPDLFRAGESKRQWGRGVAPHPSYTVAGTPPQLHRCLVQVGSLEAIFPIAIRAILDNLYHTFFTLWPQISTSQSVWVP